MRGHHQLCRVSVQRVVVGHKTDFDPIYLVGRDPATGEETRIDASTFGGNRKPVFEWKVVHG